jgi:CMP-N-acetylneuraminate monooxygenase
MERVYKFTRRSNIHHFWRRSGAMSAISIIKRVGTLAREVLRNRKLQIDLTGYSAGVHAVDDIFFCKKPAGGVAWVISRVCDHAGGKLILRNDLGCAICPFHGWRLDLETLSYTNVQQKKETLEFEVKNRMLVVDLPEIAISLPLGGEPTPLKVRLLSHACVLIEAGGLRLVTDPWLLGPAFSTGWWPAFEPRDDAIDLLRTADLIYVSHNHPDHCHLETLSHVRAGTPIIVPNFKTGAVVRLLEAFGHNSVVPLEPGVTYDVGGTVSVAILKSGDFREDSGLYLSNGSLHALLTVDANWLNGGTLPRNLDLLMTSFAGGASGYPWCFEMYNDETRAQIAAGRLRALRSLVEIYVGATRPRVYIPYAGFFKESAPRDEFIRKNNRKNTVSEILQLVRRVSPTSLTIDPTDTDEVEIRSSDIIAHRIQRERLYVVNDGYVTHYLDRFKSEFNALNVDAVVSYFENSGFRDDLKLLLVPSDDDFHFQPTGVAFEVDFWGPQPQVIVIEAREAAILFNAYPHNSRKHVKYIKVRSDSLMYIVRNKMPWEDLIIGFQCRINRKPDVYNSNFWFHFSNIYIGREHRRTIAQCDGCERIGQRLDSALAEAVSRQIEPRSNSFDADDVLA